MRRSLLVVFTAVVGFFAGCANPTPQDRISQNQKIYDSFPPEVQRQVRAGEIQVGFTPEMVWLALGRPTRAGKFSLRNSSDVIETWIYQSTSSRNELYGSGGFGGTTFGPGANQTEHARVDFTRNDLIGRACTITFRNGRVASVQPGVTVAWASR